MDHSTKVALIHTDRRRGGIAEALSLVAADAPRSFASGSRAVVLPDLETPARPWFCTHADAVSAVADFLLHQGVTSLTIAGRAGRSKSSLFDSLGYRRELWNRPVDFHDLDELNADNKSGETVAWTGCQGASQSARLSHIIDAAPCLVSLKVAKTHETFRVGLGLTQLLNLLTAPDSRTIQQLQTAERSSLLGMRHAMRWADGCRGTFQRMWLGVRSFAGGMCLTPAETHRLDQVEEATNCLMAIAARIMPRLSIIDGFTAMAGQGPRHGGRVKLRTIIAGTDPVAVDAVAAAVMGFEPMEIPYLRAAHKLRLGTADLPAITILGDPLSQSRQIVRKHSADRLLRLANSSGMNPARGQQPRRPHFGMAPQWQALRTASRDGRDANRI